ncbi:SCO family protein [Aliiroseovarius sp. KMU-50]|uniref:SCO family protein n=1 Tax=Aliiroseovarius salicola TaxID=3009082 RepID=A0ABT4VYY5_9RHOB|nr:SCO family protein [Aliiroseovarius sp. KMU-50]MDA5092935.1 SCO family protein [Aliiroseovarius sp. KMU-50]
MMRVYAATAAVAVAVLLGVTVYVTTGDEDQFAQCREYSVGTGAASIGGPFELVDENGETVTDKDLITKPTLIYFGYTFCPDVCPLDSARNAEALDLLQTEGYDAQLAFVTIDPERDGVEEVREFTDYLHPDMIGLTGTPAQIRAASKAYKTYYRKQDGDPEYYLVDHSTFTYLVTPKSGFLEFFKRDDTPQDMADRVGCFIDAEG